MPPNLLRLLDNDRYRGRRCGLRGGSGHCRLGLLVDAVVLHGSLVLLLLDEGVLGDSVEDELCDFVILEETVCGDDTDEQLVAAGIQGGMVRFSVGLENVDDILADLEKALKNA